MGRPWALGVPAAVVHVVWSPRVLILRARKNPSPQSTQRTPAKFAKKFKFNHTASYSYACGNTS
jgi:hypothetical protein